MLSFVDSLKKVIADIQITGGASVEHSTPSSSLLQKLREYALQRAENRAPEWTLLEWFTEGFFDEYVRVCVVHLRKLGISDDNLVFKLIAKVVDSQLSAKVHRWGRKEGDFEERLALSLIDIWEQMGDEQTLIYTFAQERWLIAWDHQKSHWKATSLGQLLLELSPVQAATFLLSIDTLFSTGRHDFRHISAEVLNSLLHFQPDEYEPFHLIPVHRDILTRLGILREPDDYVRDRIELTPIGKIVLRRVLDKDNPLRDAALALIETEEAEKGIKELEDWQATYARQAIERKFNPYISGAPIREPDMFFGREEALAEVLDTIHNNHIAIYGERRIGKTSLLHQLDSRLREVKDPQYLFIPAFVNLQGVPAERLFYTMMGAIAKSCQPRVGPLDLICASKKEGYDAYDLVDDLETALEAVEATTDKQIRLVLLLDEGDELNEYDPRVQARLRGIFMTRAGRYLRMVWSGLSIDKEWKLDTSPWYNLFAIEIHLAPFTREEALRLIQEPVKGIYRYDKDAIELILQHSEYKPFRIQQICLAAINRVLAQKRHRVTGPIWVTKEDVERAYQGLAAEKAISREMEERGKVELLEKQVAEDKAEYQVNTDRQGDQ
jgi:hypothetical protein